MGGLIQTKGTQRLQRLFNDRFDGSAPGIAAARNVASSVCSLRAAFQDKSLDLLEISEKFIADNAVAATWPADMNDFLYPSATLKAIANQAGAAPNVVTFAFPSGFGPAMPTPSPTVKCAIVAGSAVCGIDNKSIPKGAVVGAVTAPIAGNKFSVTLVDRDSGANVPVTVAVGDKISFARGKHERLVRRWRWYLQFDLKKENHDAIRQAISIALEDTTFGRVNFQTVEDTQRVLVTPRPKLNPNDELDDEMHMDILLLTQSTTAPFKLDPQ